MNTLDVGEWPAAGRQVLSWAENDYVIRVFDSVDALTEAQWAALLAAEDRQGRAGAPFMTPEYLGALQGSSCASPATGWTLCLVTLWQHAAPATCGGTAADAPVAACALYIKTHSYGEYVFDWAWADAYHRHGLHYYPKAVVAVPFTPVPGPRLLANCDADRRQLAVALVQLCQQLKLSSLHMLFAHDADIRATQAAGWMLRQTVQFHWDNTAGWHTFDEFLAALSQEKRKKIRQERRKVREAGVSVSTLHGKSITPSDWDFFYRCYERTYLEHGNPPYLNRDFFAELASRQPDNWLMFVASRIEPGNPLPSPIACSLIALNSFNKVAGASFSDNVSSGTAYGRYWGALERVDCLHFELCYYQPLEWCLSNGITRFEGGAQGEHKMARALLPVSTVSAHWLAHPGFADAVERHLARESEGMDRYMDALIQRTPLKAAQLTTSAPHPLTGNALPASPQQGT
ncbi:MAG TPA: GNAT family N-acetyltransferase [Burkholderiaceae bacterium]|nr:GNAT family N-acetyltransferase [Burkholderiaceae bacterium]